jgi:very-short-patch-repair endonuclease
VARLRKRVSTTTRARAQQLRREATFPERLLWSRLRSSQLGGIKFRQQHPIEPYIIDFYCPKARLAVELNGSSHDDRAKHDEERTRYLQSLEMRVIRFTDDEVLNDLENVLHVIACECGMDR